MLGAVRPAVSTRVFLDPSIAVVIVVALGRGQTHLAQD